MPIQPELQTNGAEHRLTTEQLAALAAPSLRRIVEALAEWGPLTRRDLADRLGAKAASLPYPLRRLADLGLVVEAGRRPSGRRPEVVYGLVAPRLLSEPVSQTPEGRAALARAGRAAARAAGIAFHASVLEIGAPLNGEYRGAAVRRLALTLSPSGLAALNASIDRFVEEAAQIETGEILTALTLVLSTKPPDL